MTCEVGMVCTGVSDSGADGVTREMCALFGGSVGQRVEIREHNQLQCGQLWCKLCSADGFACIGYFMIRT